MAQAKPFEDIGFERLDDEQVHGMQGMQGVRGRARAGRVPEFIDLKDCK
jgi:hypothetical protein